MQYSWCLKKTIDVRYVFVPESQVSKITQLVCDSYAFFEEASPYLLEDVYEVLIFCCLISSKSRTPRYAVVTTFRSHVSASTASSVSQSELICQEERSCFCV